jgi:hypothetical protein
MVRRFFGFFLIIGRGERRNMETRRAFLLFYSAFCQVNYNTLFLFEFYLTLGFAFAFAFAFVFGPVCLKNDVID